MTCMETDTVEREDQEAEEEDRLAAPDLRCGPARADAGSQVS
jgi:hypothetical protein